MEVFLKERGIEINVEELLTQMVKILGHETSEGVRSLYLPDREFKAGEQSIGVFQQVMVRAQVEDEQAVMKLNHILVNWSHYKHMENYFLTRPSGNLLL